MAAGFSIGSLPQNFDIEKNDLPDATLLFFYAGSFRGGHFLQSSKVPEGKMANFFFLFFTFSNSRLSYLLPKQIKKGGVLWMDRR